MDRSTVVFVDVAWIGRQGAGLAGRRTKGQVHWLSPQVTGSWATQAVASDNPSKTGDGGPLRPFFRTIDCAGAGCQTITLSFYTKWACSRGTLGDCGGGGRGREISPERQSGEKICQVRQVNVSD